MYSSSYIVRDRNREYKYNEFLYFGFNTAISNISFKLEVHPEVRYG